MHGKGVFIGKDGQQYDGEWYRSRRHGQGTQITSAGDMYIGAHVHHRRAGVGTMRYIAGGLYHGEWLDDERSGEGRMVISAAGAVAKAEAPSRRTSLSAVRRLPTLTGAPAARAHRLGRTHRWKGTGRAMRLTGSARTLPAATATAAALRRASQRIPPRTLRSRSTKSRRRSSSLAP